MNYLIYGNKQDKAIVLIHGMASMALLCYESILKYFESYYIVLVEVDRHSKNVKGDLLSLKEILFLRGAKEPYPRKSAAILKNYLSQMEEKILDGMGHGQYLHEHPAEYVNALLRFFNGRK